MSPASPTVVPRATYRLQFHRDLTLQQARELVPYLAALGVSHVYASPLLKARPGSRHGYDVCDYSQLNPELGTPAEFDLFVDALRRHGMGLVLDLVPNHAGIGTPENRWWWDVLAHGPASRYANYFDIDWHSPDPALRGKVLVPILRDDYEHALTRRELRLELAGGTPLLRYFEHRLPLAPDSVRADPRALAALNDDPARLDALIRPQHYLLASWRDTHTRLDYRRFFDIATLAGMRLEDPQVFQATHERVFAWCAQSQVDGLRVDHPDGLRDPHEYLHRLRVAAPSTWIVVEKILQTGEELPEDWPAAGTTGYEFLNRVNGLFIDPGGEPPLTDFYAAFTGQPTDYPAIVREKKRLVLQELLAAEVDRLTRLVKRIARHRKFTFSPDNLREAVIELTANLAVYRTYGRATKGRSAAGHAAIYLSRSDIGRLERAFTSAREQCPNLGAELGLLREVFLGAASELECEFVLRFQQLSGPAMAKGVEDTVFYCFNRFIGSNEVGGDPGRFGVSVPEFHQFCAQAQSRWPASMLATSTHDTKRSEDVRARLALLSEIPAEWSAAVRRWSAMNEKHRRGSFPDRNAEYLFYQTLVGAWPLPVDRALAYAQKAACESKQYTTWTRRHNAYDDAMKLFVTSTLNDAEFTASVERFVGPLLGPGWINSLSQTLLKLTAPGVPDLYQGTELWDLSLVDPDNRRQVDFTLRRRLLAQAQGACAEEAWGRRKEGLSKLWLIVRTLEFRVQAREAFGTESSYQPLAAEGAKAAHVVAFCRGRKAVTVVPRLILGLGGDWADTRLQLPDAVWRNELTGDAVHGRGVYLRDLLQRFPVALLSRSEH